MDTEVKEAFVKSEHGNKQERYEAYQYILEATEHEVDWAYEVWDELLESLSHKDNHQRSRAAQYLSNLAGSDPDKRMIADFDKLWLVTRDEKFVTARHSLQSVWKVGMAGPEQREMVMRYMSDRFIDCTEEKNYTLIRSDIIQNMRHLYDRLEDEQIKNTAFDLIEQVEEPAYKKKYSAIWK